MGILVVYELATNYLVPSSINALHFLNCKSFILEKIKVKILHLILSHGGVQSKELFMDVFTCIRFGLRATQATLTCSSLFLCTLSQLLRMK